ncbi:MAG: MFS transporter [Lentimicrobiaceae bacterium]|jgi:fucose permease|nr:MFS transporter [Lentimicrobiaceae bacterium]MCP4910653.1 sugar MFS transporter [Bacteroidota bacterium]MBT3453387.1 MFS transporter [Lentimicrobiaceae bacterium]MBT3818488.1 MFS transporter [Lentimicrobiaceae bacterium]MBT4060856.1 MFS transporter [Lentimicrobiaceae bacterium]
MKKSANAKIFIPVIFSFFVMGFVDLVGVSTGYVKNDFNLSDKVAQLIPFMVFIWFALVSIPTGIFQDRYNKKLTVNIGMILTAIGLFIPFIYYTLPTSLLGFALLGIGNTILQVSANPLLIDISSADTKAANLSLSQLVKAIASMLGPVITAGLALYLGNWRLVFPIFAVISVLSAIWLNSIKIDESKPEKEPATFKSSFKLLKNKYILITILAIFFMVGFDVAMNTNIATFLVSKFSLSLEAASMGIVIYFASLMAGRFIGAILLRKLDIKLFMVISTLIAILGLLGILVSEDLLLTQILIFISGLGFANVFPIMFALIVEKKPVYANELSSLIILAVSGGAIIPPIIGLLVDMFGIMASIFVLIFCMLYIAYASYYVIKTK